MQNKRQTKWTSSNVSFTFISLLLPSFIQTNFSTWQPDSGTERSEKKSGRLKEEKEENFFFLCVTSWVWICLRGSNSSLTHTNYEAFLVASANKVDHTTTCERSSGGAWLDWNGTCHHEHHLVVCNVGPTNKGEGAVCFLSPNNDADGERKKNKSRTKERPEKEEQWMASSLPLKHNCSIATTTTAEVRIGALAWLPGATCLLPHERGLASLCGRIALEVNRTTFSSHAQNLSL